MKKILSIFAAVLFVGSMFAAEVTVTKTVHDLFPDDENGTKELTLFNEDGLSISVNDKGNNGKIYDTGKEWRIYRSSDAVVTVALTSGVIKSVAFTFKYANAGTLLHGTDVMTSGTAVTVNAASTTFTVGNSDENTDNNGEPGNGNNNEGGQQPGGNGGGERKKQRRGRQRQHARRAQARQVGSSLFHGIDS